MEREIKFKECLKEMLNMLEYVEESEFSNSNNPIRNLRSMSVKVAKIEKTGKLTLLFLLAKSLNYNFFKLEVLDPTEKYFNKFGNSSVIWNKNYNLNPELARGMFIEGKNELNFIINNIKKNSHFH